jgi:hypothetical protein
MEKTVEHSKIYLGFLSPEVRALEELYKNETLLKHFR